MPDIFVSYARHDRERAKALAAALEREGFDVWWDSDLLAGDSWREQIQEKLREAKCAIVCWSNAANDSRWVTQEAEEARRRKILVPVLIDSHDEQTKADLEPPFGFRDLHAFSIAAWFDHRNPADLALVIDAIERVPGVPNGPQRVARMRDLLEREQQARQEAERRAQSLQENMRRASSSYQAPPPAPPPPRPAPPPQPAYQQPNYAHGQQQAYVASHNAPPHYGQTQAQGDAPADVGETFPWARFWARQIDLIIFSGSIGAVLGAMFPQTAYDPTAAMVVQYVVLGLMMAFYPFIDAAMVSASGGSPGRATFRIKITDDQGRNPDYGQALSRAWGAWFWGNAIGFFPLINNILSYFYLKRHGRSRWDVKANTHVVHKGPTVWSWLILVAVIVAVILLNVLVAAAGANYGSY